MEETSVSTWLQQIQHSDPIAAQRLWERYVDRLVRLARARLVGSDRKAADEEDVVIVAFEKFLRMAEKHRFPKLSDREDLWQILVMVTEQTAIDQIRFQSAQKRGGGKVRGDSAFTGKRDGFSTVGGINEIVGHQPTPEFASLAAEQYQALLNALPAEELRTIAIAKMHGSENAEIAADLDLSVRTIERKLQLIRSIWTRVRTS